MSPGGPLGGEQAKCISSDATWEAGGATCVPLSLEQGLATDSQMEMVMYMTPVSTLSHSASGSDWDSCLHV